MATAKKPAEMSILEKLSQPFPGDVVKWRPQGNAWKKGDKFFARVVAYVDARIVIDRLNEVCGLDWQKKTTETAKGRVLCAIGITLADGREVWRDDGAGDTQIEGEKGAISDALKRAAVNFGIGTYLYALPSPSVEVEVYEKGGKFVPKGILRHEKEKLAKACQRKLDDWTKALKEIDAGDEDDDQQSPPQPAPQTKADKSEAPKAASMPEPSSDLKPAETEPEPKKEVAPKKAPSAPQPAQTKSGGHRVRSHEFPQDQDEDGWKVWGQKVMASVKASASREEALAQVEANQAGFDKMKELGSKTDAKALVVAVVDKRFPALAKEESPAPRKNAQGRAFPNSIVVDFPKVKTPRFWEEWAGDVLRIIKTYAETDAQVEEIIEANREGVDHASAALKTAVDAKLRGYAAKHFQAQSAAV